MNIFRKWAIATRLALYFIFICFGPVAWFRPWLWKRTLAHTGKPLLISSAVIDVLGLTLIAFWPSKWPLFFLVKVPALMVAARYSGQAAAESDAYIANLWVPIRFITLGFIVSDLMLCTLVIILLNHV